MGMFIVTVLIGFFAEAFVGGLLNWPGAGTVFAIAFVGAMLNSRLRDMHEGNDNGKSEDDDKKD